ncbi:MAG: DNA/RNA nuclease SfsA [Thermoplasmata archaeon]|nr:DNA/RNA nuclease SfsA [Thermoplasmata archaeon]
MRAVRFVARPNRFLAWVRPTAGGTPRLAHVPNPGRMEELLIPGVTKGWTVAAAAGRRRTGEDLVCVVHDGTNVSIDSNVASRVIGQFLGAGVLRPPRRSVWSREVVWGGVRLDFGRFAAGGRRVVELLEVKSSNLKVGPSALFPDAPTTRGARHLRALTRARRRGILSKVVFAVQRDDVAEFRPNRYLDPEFARALDAASAAGVALEAVTLRVEPATVRLGRRIPVVLDR